MRAGISLKWQAVLIALGALLVSHVIAIAVYSSDREDTVSAAAIVDLAERMSSYVAIGAGLDPESRQATLRRAQGRMLTVRFGTAPAGEDCKGYGRRGEVDRLIAAAVPAGVTWTSCLSAIPTSRAKRLTQPGLPATGRETLHATFTFPDGAAVTFDGLVRDDPPFLLDSAVIYILLVGLATSGAAYWLILRATQPLSRFGRHAGEIGRNLDSPPLPETGPSEVRSAVRAFNRMHAQLKRLVDGRVEMLAAISHDLRTPIARLKLRTEFLPETPDKAKLQDTLEEMEEMTSAVLAFVRGVAPSEPERVVELASLIDSLCADLADAGLPVLFAGEWAEVRYSCRPTPLRRAINNLIDNAVKYGGGAEVRMRREGDRVVIAVLDRGPGVDAAQIDKLVMPFFRGETSRNRETGGHGLGLSIASSIADAHGGELVIRNREGGGLQVSLVLPR